MMKTTPRATRVACDALRKLPTSIRPIVDAADVNVPDGDEL